MKEVCPKCGREPEFIINMVGSPLSCPVHHTWFSCKRCGNKMGFEDYIENRMCCNNPECVKARIHIESLYS